MHITRSVFITSERLNIFRASCNYYTTSLSLALLRHYLNPSLRRSCKLQIANQATVAEYSYGTASRMRNIPHASEPPGRTTLIFGVAKFAQGTLETFITSMIWRGQSPVARCGVQAQNTQGRALLLALTKDTALTRTVFRSSATFTSFHYIHLIHSTDESLNSSFQPRQDDVVPCSSS